jgi:hypothetical protein
MVYNPELQVVANEADEIPRDSLDETVLQIAVEVGAL